MLPFTQGCAVLICIVCTLLCTKFLASIGAGHSSCAEGHTAACVQGAWSSQTCWTSPRSS